MATIGQIYHNVMDTNSGGPLTDDVNIFQDIVKAYGATSFTKVGVQAPPGTQMILNDKTIMVGRTGIYELDEDISITTMRFIQPQVYEKDEAETQIAKEQGEAGMKAAEEARSKALDSLHTRYGDTRNDAYWEEYNNIQAIYIEAYKAALNKYNQGCNGIYILVKDSYKDLDNVIVDFIYE